MSGRAFRYLTHPTRGAFVSSTDSRPTTSCAGVFGFDPLNAIERRGMRGFDAAIMTIPLRGFTPSFADRMFERRCSLLLRSGSAGHVENFFLQDGAMQVIYTITKGNLRKRQTHADPIGSEMIDVVQVNTANGEVAKLLNRRS